MCRESCTSTSLCISQPGKLTARKLGHRLRQFARNVQLPEAYFKVLNPVNLVGFFKYREALRMRANPSATPAASTGTRNVILSAWRSLHPNIAPPECVPASDFDCKINHDMFRIL